MLSITAITVFLNFLSSSNNNYYSIIPYYIIIKLYLCLYKCIMCVCALECMKIISFIIVSLFICCMIQPEIICNYENVIDYATLVPKLNKIIVEQINVG